MRLLDLFSGIGGFSLAASWAGITPIQFVEFDSYCQKVLNKNFSGVPIHGDIKTFKGQKGSADIISGGFPCQPFSVAGEKRGAEDDRALWPEMFRVIKEVRPDWVLGENVAGIVNMELDNVLSDLESEDYETQAFIIPACAVDAPHRRNRVWIVANAGCESTRPKERGTRGEQIDSKKKGERPEARNRFTNSGQDVCNSERERLEAGKGTQGQRPQPAASGSYRWAAEPDVGRVAYGIPRRVDRLKGLGNAIVPQVAYQIFKSIIEVEKQ